MSVSSVDSGDDDGKGRRKLGQARRSQVKDAVPDVQPPGQLNEIDRQKGKKPSEKRSRQR
jgi:hypothetical protein